MVAKDLVSKTTTTNSATKRLLVVDWLRDFCLLRKRDFYKPGEKKTIAESIAKGLLLT